MQDAGALLSKNFEKTTLKRLFVLEAAHQTLVQNRMILWCDEKHGFEFFKEQKSIGQSMSMPYHLAFTASLEPSISDPKNAPANNELWTSSFLRWKSIFLWGLKISLGMT